MAELKRDLIYDNWWVILQDSLKLIHPHFKTMAEWCTNSSTFIVYQTKVKYSGYNCIVSFSGKKKYWVQNRGFCFGLGFFLFCIPTGEQVHRNRGLWADSRIIQTGLYLGLKLFLQFIPMDVKRRQILFRSFQWNQKSSKLNALLETQIIVLRIKANDLRFSCY